jgi:hypothetical protein
MALAQRVPSGALLNLGMFDDEFDAVMAAAMEADPTVWKLDAKAPAQAVPVQATAANTPACVVALSAAARCVDQTHRAPCCWCVRPLPVEPGEDWGSIPGPACRARARSLVHSRRLPGARPRPRRRTRASTSWWETPGSAS